MRAAAPGVRRPQRAQRPGAAARPRRPGRSVDCRPTPRPHHHRSPPVVVAARLRSSTPARRAACVSGPSDSGGPDTRSDGGVSGPFRAALKTYRKFSQHRRQPAGPRAAKAAVLDHRPEDRLATGPLDRPVLAAYGMPPAARQQCSIRPARRATRTSRYLRGTTRDRFAVGD
jgi:hypothetical protein